MRPPRELPAQDCPSPDDLRRVARGVAPGAEEAALERHLDGCIPCRARFESFLDPPDGLNDLRPADLDRAETEAAEVRARGIPLPPTTRMLEGQVMLRA